MSKVYCPNCQSVTKMDSKGSARQLMSEDRVYYKRQKMCQKCNKVITTVEVEESLIQEYDILKKLVGKINSEIRPFVAKGLNLSKK